MRAFRVGFIRIFRAVGAPKLLVVVDADERSSKAMGDLGAGYVRMGGPVGHDEVAQPEAGRSLEARRRSFMPPSHIEATLAAHSRLRHQVRFFFLRKIYISYP